jgi:hypothetical protein
VAAMTIPISIGYAQVCGMPAVYGLYGSVFPILIFAMFSTSPQFIFGVDAAPCAVVGAFLSTHGIAAASQQAMEVVPLITLFAGLWLLLFSILKAGKLVNFISTPVMGDLSAALRRRLFLCRFLNCSVLLRETANFLSLHTAYTRLQPIIRVGFHLLWEYYPLLLF